MKRGSFDSWYTRWARLAIDVATRGDLLADAVSLYFTIGAAAIERGFHVLIFEGPGQGNLLREYRRPFTPEWERPAAAALDSLTDHCTPRATVGVGVSFGGHLLARAAA